MQIDPVYIFLIHGLMNDSHFTPLIQSCLSEGHQTVIELGSRTFHGRSPIENFMNHPVLVFPLGPSTFSQETGSTWCDYNPGILLAHPGQRWLSRPADRPCDFLKLDLIESALVLVHNQSGSKVYARLKLNRAPRFDWSIWDDMRTDLRALSVAGYARSLLAWSWDQLERGAEVVNPERERFEAICDHIEGHLDSELSRHLVARHFHCHETQISRWFRKHANVSFVEHVKRRRMEKAKAILGSTNHPISRVSSWCGFESPQYFIKCFREVTGLTPKRWRDRLNG